MTDYCYCYCSCMHEIPQACTIAYFHRFVLAVSEVRYGNMTMEPNKGIIEEGISHHHFTQVTDHLSHHKSSINTYLNHVIIASPSLPFPSLHSSQCLCTSTNLHLPRPPSSLEKHHLTKPRKTPNYQKKNKKASNVRLPSAVHHGEET